jgi:hypothetical protein
MEANVTAQPMAKNVSNSWDLARKRLNPGIIYRMAKKVTNHKHTPAISVLMISCASEVSQPCCMADNTIMTKMTTIS